LLRHWVTTYEQVLEEVPPDRLLVVRTDELDGSLDALASFCGVDPAALVQSRAKVRKARTNVLGQVSRAYVVERADAICGGLMDRYWGSGWRSLASRLPSGQ
jgi:hypothetical protein